MAGKVALEGGVDVRASLFEQHRPRLRGLAYRMLGAIGDAEDIVQEAYLRWHEVDPATIRSAEAWLVATTTRLAIDRLRARAAERRAYVGPWLPEPWPGDLDDGAAPDRQLERAGDLSIAFLLLLERLTPEERAAFVLREVFEVDYADVARSLDKSEAACRQLVHRARGRMRDGRPRFDVDHRQHGRLIERFVEAIRAGDSDTLLSLLAPDATLVSDGGGKVLAARNVIFGADRVARFLLGVAGKRAGRFLDQVAIINGEPGVVRKLDGALNATISIALDGNAVGAVYVVMNPDKLRHVAAVRSEAPGLA